jgi:hypothetical protein
VVVLEGEGRSKEAETREQELPWSRGL